MPSDRNRGKHPRSGSGFTPASWLNVLTIVRIVLQLATWWLTGEGPRHHF
jgi:hypothetical protein